MIMTLIMSILIKLTLLIEIRWQICQNIRHIKLNSLLHLLRNSILFFLISVTISITMSDNKI